MFDALSRRILEPPAFGLDISDLTVKFCKLIREGKGYAISHWGEIPIPPGIILDGEIHDEKGLIGVLSKDLKSTNGQKIRDHYCVASLPEEKSFVHMLDLPLMKQEDLAHAIRWEIEGVIPLPISQIFYDYEPAPKSTSSDHLDVLATAFPQVIVESYHRVLTGSNLKVLALELESQATCRAILSQKLLTKSLIIVNFGATRTNFIIVAGGSIVFTKTSSIGGRDLELALTGELGVSAEEARRIKIEVGLNKQFGDGGAFRAIEPILANLMNELTQELWFFREHPAKKHSAFGDIEEIILCGGDANLLGLERYVATAIKKPVSLGNPMANLSLPPGEVPPIPKAQSLKYATAVGLALRAIGYQTRYV